MIQRSHHRLNRQEFDELLQLIQHQPWLENRYDALQDLWEICADFEEQRLITQLLRRFTFLNGADFKKRIEMIRDRVIQDWCLGPENTVIAALHNDKSADSAQMVLQNLKASFASINGWTGDQFVNSMPIAANNAKDNINIVLVDEFIGTGHQSINILKKCREYIDRKKINNVKIYLSIIASMDFSRAEISKYTYQYYSTTWLKKGISEHYKGAALREARNKMKRVEKELCPCIHNKKMPSFGSGGSETLYGYDMGNSPANVFPVFWWRWLADRSVRRTLLSRI